MALRDVLTGALSLVTDRHLTGGPAPVGQAGDGGRTDSWVNPGTGFGTGRDKSQGTYYCATPRLQDFELTELYNGNDLAAKVVDVPVRACFKRGYFFCGPENTEALKAFQKYTQAHKLPDRIKSAVTWGRLYGGCGVWVRFVGDTDPILPLPTGALPEVESIEVIDRRHLWPMYYYTEGPKAGRPMTYSLYIPRAGGAPVYIGQIHETRLVTFGGAMTEPEEKIRLRGWDLSVLQRPYEALQATGNIWKAIEVLTIDANQAVYGIKGLWRMIASDPTQLQDSTTGSGNPSGGLLNRIKFMDLMRSVSRAIVLDKDDETFERKPTTFTGLPDLSDLQWKRVAAASEIPRPLLDGEFPSGLNSTGDGPFRVFYDLCEGLQEQEYGPRVLELARLFARSASCPVQFSDVDLEDLGVDWHPLWIPNAIELADIRIKRAQEGQILQDAQVISAEEHALSIPEEWGWKIDRDKVQQQIDDLAAMPEEEQGASTLALTPTDIAAVVTVNQALASVNLPPMTGPDGEMTVEAYRAKAAAAGAEEGAPTPPPVKAPGGFGAPSGAGFPPKGPKRA